VSGRSLVGERERRHDREASVRDRSLDRLGAARLVRRFEFDTELAEDLDGDCARTRPLLACDERLGTELLRRDGFPSRPRMLRCYDDEQLVASEMKQLQVLITRGVRQQADIGVLHADR
jgi:hypothetical protein